MYHISRIDRMSVLFLESHLKVAILAVSVLLTAPGRIMAGITHFQGLGDLPGGSVASWANGISADGRVVVGSSWSDGGQEAFRWTVDEGIVGLGDLPGSNFSSTALAVSADGTVIVGRGSSDIVGESFRWTAETGMVNLGTLRHDQLEGSARAVSADGTVIVGDSGSGIGWRYDETLFEAFRWTADTGMIGLGDFADRDYNQVESSASGISADGGVIVGTGDRNPYRAQSEAFRRTAASGLIRLGGPPESHDYSNAQAVSADGRVVAGFSKLTTGEGAFRWTAERGMVLLSTSSNAIGFRYAAALSADGSIIVGDGRFTVSSGARAVVWDAVHGVRAIEDVLEDGFGLDLADWTLQSARGISADGLTIVGSGINPDGLPEAWIAVIPEPCTVSFLLVITSVCAIRRHRF